MEPQQMLLNANAELPNVQQVHYFVMLQIVHAQALQHALIISERL
jgi:hypothetical protein